MRSYREMFPQYADRFEAESHFLHMVLPSVVRPGEPFRLRAVMMDAHGMPEEGWTGVVPLRCEQRGLRFPDVIEFTPDDLGRVSVEGLVAEQPGAYVLQATPEPCPGRSPMSNPVLARENGPRLFWGDTHVHTVVGNCHRDRCKSPEFGYWYGREVALMDFAAAMDHLRGIHSEEGRWKHLVDAARGANVPGEFVTFLGFESSHSREHGGDNNIYYSTADAEHFWLDRDDMWGASPSVGLDRLWAWLEERDVPYLSIPHHTGRAHKYRNFELDFHNPDCETVLEVFSWWGSSEQRHDDLYLKGGKTDCRAYWRDALELGYRYGVIGSSDNHTTMPGTPFPDIPNNWWYCENKLNCQGMAAIYAEELTREAIFTSLKNRRCFATTWWRPLLDMEVNGVPMGQAVGADSAARQSRRIQATLTSAWGGKLQLLRNFEPLAQTGLDGPLTEWEYVDEEPLEDLCIKDAPRSPEPFVFYHLKYTSGNGQIAWSSPVWLTL